MAESFIRKTEDEVSCPICMELFVDPNTPKNLPCGHVCCEVCLKCMVAGNAARSCPECRKNIPRGGVTEFPTNFRLRTLAENYQKVDDTQSSVAVDDNQSSGASVKPVCKTDTPRCPKHEDEEILHYCSTCNASVCKTCLDEEHHHDDGHESVEVETFYLQKAAQMQAKLVTTTCNIEQLKKSLQMLEEKKKADKNLVEAEKQLEKAKEESMDKIKQHYEDLKKQLQTKATEPHDQKIREVRQVIKIAERKQQAATNALQYNPKHEYVTQHDYLTDDIDQVKMEETMSQAVAAVPTVVRFVPNKTTPKLGRAVSCTPDRPREIELIQTLDEFERAGRIACSPTGLLAVIDSDGQRVVIYHKVYEKYEVKLHLNLKSNMSKPVGVAIHPDGKYLVSRCACIEVYSPHGQYLEGIQTGAASSTTMNIVEIRTTSDGRILAGDIKRSVITEYDAIGNIKKTLRTTIHPVHMTLIHDSHIALSDWKAGKVSVMDMNTGHETLSIDMPQVLGVCYDEQTECLLIARSEPGSGSGTVLFTGVIEQYSYITGKLVASLDQGLYHPYGISLTSDGNLVVANEKDVKIYRFK